MPDPSALDRLLAECERAMDAAAEPESLRGMMATNERLATVVPRLAAVVRVLRDACTAAPALLRELTCEVCHGAGTCGYEDDGRKIACMECGGHEDSAGSGLRDPRVAQAVEGLLEPALAEANRLAKGEA